MSEAHTISDKAHERADNALVKAAAIVRLAMNADVPREAAANAMWAVSDLIEEAHQAIGRY